MRNRNTQNSSQRVPSPNSTSEANTTVNSQQSINDRTSTQSNRFHDTAANEDNAPFIDLDISHRTPNFLQPVAHSKSTWILRMIIVGTSMVSVVWFYPESLSNIRTTFKRVKTDWSNYAKNFELESLSIEAMFSEVEKTPDNDMLDASIMTARRNTDNDDLLGKLDQMTIDTDDALNYPDYIQDDEPFDSNRQTLLNQFELKPDNAPSLDGDQSPQLLTPDNSVENSLTVNEPTITSTEIDTVIDKFCVAYAQGNARELRKIFMQPGNNQQSLDKKLLQINNFLFTSTKQRRVEFKDLVWVPDNNISIGTGTITSTSTLRNNAHRIANARVKIQLQRSNGEIKIADLSLTKKHTTQKTVLSNLTSAKYNQSISDIVSPMLPSLSELNNVVSRFVWAYEGGDIEVLDGLLANNAVSSNKSGKTQIKKAYVDLFNSSSERQMLINDLQWKFAKTHARGVANMKSVIVSQDKETSVVQGKIQFVAKKINDKVRITHLYHIEHSP